MPKGIEKMNIKIFGMGVLLSLGIVGCSSSEEVAISKKEQKESQVKKESITAEQYYTRGILFLKEEDLKKAKVIQVIEGDTLKVEMDGNQEILRTTLVETPKKQDFQEPMPSLIVETINFARETLEGKEVELEIDKEQRDKDGNVQAYVWVDNKPYNVLLLDEGFARLRVETSNAKYQNEFQQIETSAKSAKVGIWKVEGYATDSGFNSEVLRNYKSQPAPQVSTDSNDSGSQSPYSENKLKTDPKAPSTNPRDYNKDGEYVPQGGPTDNPADYNSKGEYKPADEMTQDEIEAELEEMLKDSLGQ